MVPGGAEEGREAQGVRRNPAPVYFQISIVVVMFTQVNVKVSQGFACVLWITCAALKQRKVREVRSGAGRGVLAMTMLWPSICGPGCSCCCKGAADFLGHSHSHSHCEGTPGMITCNLASRG